MSDTPTNNLEPEALDEELVAYFDGELPPDSAKRVEGVLAADSKARERLGDLAASWDLLDQLPRATVDDLFTRTTVEMVAVAAESEIAAASAPAKRRLQWIGGGVAVLLAAVVGFAAAALALPNQNELLLKDLPVVADLELYRGVSDIAFVKQLQKEGLFTEDLPVIASQPSAGITPEKFEKSEKPVAIVAAALPPIPATIEARRAWVEALPSVDKTELRRNFEWFAARPAEQQELRQFDKELRADPQAAELYKVMQRYHEWLKTLVPAERAELALKSLDNRVAEIKRRQQQQVAIAFVRYAGGGGGGGGPNRGPEFGGTQFVAAFRLAQQYAMNHEQEILAQLPDEERSKLLKIKSEDDERGDVRRKQYPASLAVELWRHNSTVKLQPMKDSELEALMNPPTLSKEQAERLKSIVDSPDRMKLLRNLVQAGIAANRPFGWGRGGGGGPTPDWIITQLPADVQKQLEGLSPDDRERKLRELRRSQDWPRSGMGPGPGPEWGPESRPFRGPPGQGPRRSPDGPPPGEGPRGGQDAPPKDQS